MISDSQLNLSWPVIGVALKIHFQSLPTVNLVDPTTYVFKVTNQLPSTSSTNPKAFSERYITVLPSRNNANYRTNQSQLKQCFSVHPPSSHTYLSPAPLTAPSGELQQ